MPPISLPKNAEELQLICKHFLQHEERCFKEAGLKKHELRIAEYRNIACTLLTDPPEKDINEARNRIGQLIEDPGYTGVAGVIFQKKCKLKKAKEAA
jgi:hypothetical protein